MHTVTFLNKFTLSCEERLLQFEYKLQRIEASLEILESWVCNIYVIIYMNYFKKILIIFNNLIIFS